MFVPIAKTEVDWQVLLPNAQKALGRSISASLDKANVTSAMGPVSAFMCALAELNQAGTDALAALRDDVGIRRHASFSFLVNIQREAFFWLRMHDLDVVPASDGDFAVVSADLGRWVEFVARGSSDQKLRKFCCLLLAWFERQNLGEAWAAWEKSHQPDGLFTLVRKPR